jgi:hypothetical protein
MCNRRSRFGSHRRLRVLCSRRKWDNDDEDFGKIPSQGFSVRIGREVPNSDFKSAWAEIAIEWHALAARRAQEVSQDRELRK